MMLRRFLAYWFMTWALLTSGIVLVIVCLGGVVVNAVPVIELVAWTGVCALAYTLYVARQERTRGARQKARA